MKKSLAVFLVIFTVTFLLTSCVKADLKYKYNKETNELKISGKGEMPRYDSASPPWAKVKKPIHIIVQASVESISDNAFNAEYKWGDNAKNYFSDIQTVELSSSVKTIGKYAFKGCKYLRSIDIPKKVEKIGEGAFENCGWYTFFHYPQSLRTIEDKVFKNCTDLNGISFSNKIESIGNEAFYGDKKLIYFELPENLKRLGGKAFYGCEKLKGLYIPEKVTQIGEKAFYNCKRLKAIIISSSVKEIGDKAFGFYSENKTEKKVKDLVIKGKAGSAAQSYAEKYGFKFIKETHTPATIDKYKKQNYYKGLNNFGYVDTFYASMADLEKRYYDIDGGKNPFYLYSEMDEVDETYKYQEYDCEDILKKEPLDFYEYEKRLIKKLTETQRQAGDYVITDYKDGVCINKIVFDKKKFKKGKNGYVTVDIPEKIDGKKVVKLGAFFENTEDSEDMYESEAGHIAEAYAYNNTHGFLETFPDGYHINLNIPSTVKEIPYDAFQEYLRYDGDGGFKSKGYIANINVDKKNPYYTSEDGVMYTKDMKWLLFARPKNNGKELEYSFTVPTSVEYIADTHICDNADPNFTLIIGANVKRIYSTIAHGTCGISCNIKAPKGSYAEKWAKNMGANLYI